MDFKMKWKSIQINKQNVKHDTGRTVLIAMPHNSNYDGYEFWHPAKLVREGYHSYAINLSYTDEFKFKLKKMGKGKYNKDQIIDEIEIDVEEFEEAFEVMNDNVIAPKKDTESYLNIEEPEKIDADVVVLECLKNNN